MSEKMKELQSDLKAWLETVKEAQKIPDVTPPLKIEVGEVKTVRILDESPRIVQAPSMADPEKMEDKFVLTVEDKTDNMNYTLWLSSKSLRLGIAKIYEKVGSLKNVVVKIRAENYDHAVWGEVKGYRVQVLTNVMMTLGPSK